MDQASEPDAQIDPLNQIRHERREQRAEVEEQLAQLPEDSADPVLARAAREVEAAKDKPREFVDITISGSEGDVLVMLTPTRGVRMTREEAADIPRHFGVPVPEDLYILNQPQWQALTLPLRIEHLTRHKQPVSLAHKEDLFDVLNENTKGYLRQWQQLVNTGECWFTFGEIGAAAAAMLNKGVLMAAHKDQKDFYDHTVAGRSTRTPGHEGTYGYVAALMGRKYADWLAAIE